MKLTKDGLEFKTAKGFYRAMTIIFAIVAFALAVVFTSYLGV